MIRDWSEWFFLAHPRSFLMTHLPLEGDTILPERQGVMYPVTDAKEWAETAIVSPMTVEYGVKIITHPNACIKTTSGEVRIKYECDFPLSQFVKVWQREKHGRHVREKQSDTISNQVRLVIGSTTHNTVLARFTRHGEYRVKVFGEVRLGHPALERTQCLLDYVIKNSGRCRPLPVGASTMWGMRRDFLNAGFALLEPREPIIETINGKTTVRVKLPTEHYFPNKFQLIYSDGEGGNETMTDCVLTKRERNVATYVVQCPFKGEYVLQLSTKYERPCHINEGFYIGATFLIICARPAHHVHHLDSGGSLMGTTPNFYDRGFVTSATSTVLRVRDGVARLRVKEKGNPRIHAQLVMSDKTHSKMSGLVRMKSSTFSVKTFEVELGSHRGIFILQLFVASELQSRFNYGGSFLVSNERLFD